MKKLRLGVAVSPITSSTASPTASPIATNPRPNSVALNVNDQNFTNDPSANIYKNNNKNDDAVPSNVVTSKRRKTKNRVSKNDTIDSNNPCASCSALKTLTTLAQPRRCRNEILTFYVQS